MANQPSAMVPNGSEKNPVDAGSSLHFERMNTESEFAGTPEAASFESKDQAQADLVREKLLSESAGLAPTSQTFTTLHQQNTQPATQPSLAALSPEDQIHQLVSVAHTSGLDHAFKLANATNNAYVIDRFHDELVNRVLHNKQQSM